MCFCSVQIIYKCSIYSYFVTFLVVSYITNTVI